MMKSLIGAAIAATLMTSLSAFAAGHEGHYVGIDLTSVRQSVNEGSLGLDSYDKTDIGAGVHAGYRYNDNLGVEVGYHWLGDHSLKAGGESGSVDVHALTLEAVGLYPVTKEIDVYGKFGGALTLAKADFAGVDGHDYETSLAYGVGGAYWFNDNLSVRAEWHRITDAGNLGGHADTFGIGADWKF